MALYKCIIIIIIIKDQCHTELVRPTATLTWCVGQTDSKVSLLSPGKNKAALNLRIQPFYHECWGTLVQTPAPL